MKKCLLLAVSILMFCHSAVFSQRKMQSAKRISVNNNYAMTFPISGDSTVVRFEVRPGDIAANGGRAELMDMTSGFAKHYEFSFRPIDFTYENQSFILADWHVNSELYYNAIKYGATLFSPLIIHIEGDSIILSNRAGVFTGPVENLKPKKGASRKIFKSQLLKDWNYVSVDVVWSDTSNGSIKVNINGKIKEFKNIRTTYDMKYPNFYKVGIYRSAAYKSRSIFEFKNMIVDSKTLFPDFGKKASGQQNNDNNKIQTILMKARQKN